MWSHSDVVWIYIVLKTLQIVIGKILFLMYLQVLQHIPLYHPALKGPSVELDNTFYAHRTLCKGIELSSWAQDCSDRVVNVGFSRTASVHDYLLSSYDTPWCTYSNIHSHVHLFLILSRLNWGRCSWTCHLSTHSLLKISAFTLCCLRFLIG